MEPLKLCCINKRESLEPEVNDLLCWLNLNQRRKVLTLYIMSDHILLPSLPPDCLHKHLIVHFSIWGLWDTLKRKKMKKKKNPEGEAVCFHSRVSGGGCITPSLATSRAGPCQLDLKWSCSEATARSCASININAQGNATGAQKRNLFYLPSDPYTNLCKQSSLFIVLIQQSCASLPQKRFVPPALQCD